MRMGIVQCAQRHNGLSSVSERESVNDGSAHLTDVSDDALDVGCGEHLKVLGRQLRCP